MTTKQQLNDLLEATYILQASSEGPMSMAESFYIASIQTRTSIAGLKVADLMEAVAASQKVQALILSDYEFMTLLNGNTHKEASILLFSDLTFLVFDIDGGLDTDMRGDVSWFEGGITSLQPLEDTQIVAASPGLPAGILVHKSISPEDADFGNTLRDAICAEISELVDTEMDMEDTYPTENWDADQQEEVEMWVIRATAALDLPVDLQVTVSSAFEDISPTVDVWFDDTHLHPELQGMPRSLISKWLEDILNLTVGLAEFQGGSYEYNDGAYGRKSGYSARPASLFHGGVNSADLSNHERLSARPTLIRALQKSDVCEAGIQKSMDLLDRIKKYSTEKKDA